MKFLDKVKNMFTEEVVEDEKPKDEVKIEQIIPEKKQEKVTRDRTSRESRSYNEFEEFKIPEKKEDKKPVFFTDDDFNDLDNYFKKTEPKRNVRDTKSNNDKFDLHEKYREVEEKKSKDTNYGYNNVDLKTEPKKKDYDPLKSATEYLEKYNEENSGVKEPYQGNTKIESKPPKFKPTPIISPVYGILDKNYHKEDIVVASKEKKSINVDDVRKKAFGKMEDDIEKIEELPAIDDTLDLDLPEKEDSFEDILEKSVSDTIEIDNTDELEVISNKPEVVEDKEDKNVSDETLENDLFDLIDSMYEDKEDIE